MSTIKEVPASGVTDGDSIEKLLKLDAGSSLQGLPDGVQAAYAFAPEDWRADCERLIHELAATGQVFTVDSLRRHGIEEPDKAVRWGSIFAAMRKRGVIEQTGVHLHQAARGGISAIREWRGVAQVSP
ncbi:hypothetical protein OOZ51_04995 [Arthrobacter sp. MI7-26]|uniref:hypothetical protein n=1 Tax=Arthrobacter sp. MI7-26 TaxID=2993653 RepID=UPI0022498EA4|nr:hypothetical protein [Arthrobacter sp. MI7-26]MCX2747171.1 hypothetical protein [Arthrobacter sp. MI7-26]